MSADRQPIAGVSIHIVSAPVSDDLPAGFTTSVGLGGENEDLLTFQFITHRITRDELAELLSLANQALTAERRIEIDHGGCTHDQL